MTNQKKVWPLALMLLILLSCRPENPPEIIGQAVNVAPSPGLLTLDKIRHHPNVYYASEREVAFNLDLSLSDDPDDNYTVIKTITFSADKIYCKVVWDKSGDRFLEIDLKAHEGKLKIFHLQFCRKKQCYIIEKDSFFTSRASFLSAAQECAKEAYHLAYEVSKVE